MLNKRTWTAIILLSYLGRAKINISTYSPTITFPLIPTPCSGGALPQLLTHLNCEP